MLVLVLVLLLELALEHNSFSCMRVLFEAMTPAFATPDLLTEPYQDMTENLAHVTDLLDATTLSKAIDAFPDLAFAFVVKIQLAKAFPKVAQGCQTFALQSDALWVGSESRSPHEFWLKKKNTQENGGAHQTPVKALFAPLKGIAGPNAKLLASFVRFGYPIFKAPVAEALVEFKWTTYGRDEWGF